jgi:hypothetical protein
MKRLAAALLFALLFAAPARAETRNIDYSLWTVVGNTVYARYTVPASEAKFIVPPNSKRPADKLLADYLLAHLAVSRGGEDCEAIDQGQDVGQINTLAFTPGRYLFEIQFACGGKGAISLSNTAFANVPSHVDFARVQRDGGAFAQHVFTTDATRFALPDVASDMPSDSVFRYATLGFTHVRRSIDILLFMAAIVLIVRTRRDFIVAAGGLASGYVLSLLASVLRIVSPHAAAPVLVNALLVFLAAAAAFVLRRERRSEGAILVAVSVAILAIPAFFVRGGASLSIAALGIALLAASALLLPLREGARGAFLAASCFVFALLDGFVLPGDVAIQAIGAWPLTPMTLGFDAGAFVAEMLLPLCLAGLWLYVPRLKRVVPADGILVDAAAALFIGCGVFWFVSRLYA